MAPPRGIVGEHRSWSSGGRSVPGPWHESVAVASELGILCSDAIRRAELCMALLATDLRVRNEILMNEKKARVSMRCAGNKRFSHEVYRGGSGVNDIRF